MLQKNEVKNKHFIDDKTTTNTLHKVVKERYKNKTKKQKKNNAKLTNKQTDKQTYNIKTRATTTINENKRKRKGNILKCTKHIIEKETFTQSKKKKK